MLRKLLVSTIALTGASNAAAMSFEITDDVQLDADVSLTYAVSQRMKDQDEALLADINGDDGNRSFDKGDLVNNKVSAVIDLDLRYKNYGLFARPRAYYDAAYDGRNANQSLTNNNLDIFGGELSSPDQFTQATKDQHRDTVELLDMYGYADYELGGHYLHLRAGRQMVGWGESIYLQNSISSAQNPLDVTASNVAGAKLSEIFMPVEQVTGQIDITESFSLAGYYQWKWRESILDEQGSYFSDSDAVDKAGERILVNASGLAIDRTADVDAKDDGQWGVAMRFVSNALNDTEFGVYALNYHDKYPMVIGKSGGGKSSPYRDGVIASAQPISAFAPGFSVDSLASATEASIVYNNGAPFCAPPTSAADVPAFEACKAFVLSNPAAQAGVQTAAAGDAADLASYHLAYQEDIKLYGMSFGTLVGDTNIGGEISYRTGVAVEVVDPTNILGFSYVDGDVAQVQLSAIHVFGDTFAWDSMTFTGEMGANHAYSYKNKTLNGTDEFAYGATIASEFDYLQVIAGLDISPYLKYEYNPNGTSVMAGSFEEDADEVTVGTAFTYHSDFIVDLSYTDYLGDAESNSLSDRDLLSLTANYTF
jgi:hypothetical protein